jgi:hypothetical protein
MQTQGTIGPKVQADHIKHQSEVGSLSLVSRLWGGKENGKDGPPIWMPSELFIGGRSTQVGCTQCRHGVVPPATWRKLVSVLDKRLLGRVEINV